MLFDETKADLRHEAEWEAVIATLDGAVDGDDAIAVDYDDRDLRSDAPEDAVYVLPDAKIKNKTYFTAAKTAIKDHLYRDQTLQLFRNADLKLYSRVGETREAFEERCKVAADEAADADAEKLRDAVAKKEDRVKDQLERAEDRVREIQTDLETRESAQRSDQIMDVVGAGLGMLLGGRRNTRSILSGVRRSRNHGRMAEKSEERLRTAENRFTDLAEDLEALEDELLDDLAQIQEEWDEKAANITDLEVGLEKTDITIDDIALIWIPT